MGRFERAAARYTGQTEWWIGAVNVVSDLLIAGGLVLAALSLSENYRPIDGSTGGAECMVWPPDAAPSKQVAYCYQDGKKLFLIPLLALIFATVGNLGCAFARWVVGSENDTTKERALFFAYILYFIPLIIGFCLLLVPSFPVTGDTELDQIKKRQMASGIIVLVVASLHVLFGFLSLGGDGESKRSFGLDGSLDYFILKG